MATGRVRKWRAFNRTEHSLGVCQAATYSDAMKQLRAAFGDELAVVGPAWAGATVTVPAVQP